MPAGPALEDEISDLQQLDEFREGMFRKFRDDGRKELQRFAERLHSKDADLKKTWDDEMDSGDRGIVLKALCSPATPTSVLDNFVMALELYAKDKTFDPQQLYAGGSDERAFLDTAYALNALASAPARVFSATTMHFYYLIVREIYYATPPVWVIGGARAGQGGQPSAFVTSESVRAMLSFRRMLQRTASFVRALSETQRKPQTPLDMWNLEDGKRRLLSVHTNLAQRSWNLAFALRTPLPESPADQKAWAEFEGKFRSELMKSLTESVATFESTLRVVQEHRDRERSTIELATTNEEKQRRQRRFDRSHYAHAVGESALSDAVARSKQARAIFKHDLEGELNAEQRAEFADNLRALAESFDNTAEQVFRLIQPARDYLSSVLDRELAKAGGHESGRFEAAELAAAAASVGSMSSSWDDPRLRRAADLLTSVIGDDGFPVVLPFHAGASSFYRPMQVQILKSYAQLMEHISASELPAAVLQRIAKIFIVNRHDAKSDAWWFAFSARGRRSPYQTGLAVLALDRIVRMLDARINRGVLRHFSHRRTSIRLHELFYSDYGLAAVTGKESVAVALEKMRAHVAQVPREDPLHSIVLHGPPGTGKTMLIEALAASAEVELVEVTPSDIVVRGTDAIEERARTVMNALAILTRVVILFDEFDPVLQSREVAEKKGQSASIFSFLTPGMLPKLKKLYEFSKKRNVAYALLTNVIRNLDSAAIRQGRFDRKAGIYSPDAISRYGRLWTEATSFKLENKRTPPANISERFRKVIESTENAPMQNVGQPSWFTRPGVGKQPKKGTIFEYLFESAAPLPTLPKAEPWSDSLLSEKESDELKVIAGLEADPALQAALKDACGSMDVK